MGAGWCGGRSTDERTGCSGSCCAVSGSDRADVNDQAESPQSLQALGEMVARWLEAGGPEGPDDETTPLVPVLASLNRAGFVTEFSQPGGADEVGGLRAAVSGFCERRLALTLDSLGVLTDLLVLTCLPGMESPVHIPVSRYLGRPTTWAGMTCVLGEDEDVIGQCQLPMAVGHILIRSWYVTVVDPVWGRRDALWDAIAAAVDGAPVDPSFSIWGVER